MYKIKRVGKKVPPVLKNTYASYDDARKEVRKWVLKQWEKGRVVRSAIDLMNRTISIGIYGFKIEKIKLV